jgi:hypothetical protein
MTTPCSSRIAPRSRSVIGNSAQQHCFMGPVSGRRHVAGGGVRVVSTLATGPTNFLGKPAVDGHLAAT